VAVRAPLGLPDGFLAVRPREMLEITQLAVRAERGDVELAPVPGHPGEIPREEAQTGPVRGDTRIRIEVPPLGDDPRLGCAIRGHRDELVDDVRCPVAFGVGLADAYS